MSFFRNTVWFLKGLKEYTKWVKEAPGRSGEIMRGLLMLRDGARHVSSTPATPCAVRRELLISLTHFFFVISVYLWVKNTYLC